MGGPLSRHVLQDFVIQWTDARIDACLEKGEGQAACAPLELLGTFRGRILDRLKGTMRKLKAKSLQLQDSVAVPAFTSEVARTKTHTSVVNKGQDPKLSNFRSSATGYEVELSHALGDPSLMPADRLKVLHACPRPMLTITAPSACDPCFWCAPFASV